MITGFRNEPSQDVDAMYEADTAAEWERLNEEEMYDGEKMRFAEKSLERVVEQLDLALDDLNEAAETLIDTPEGDWMKSMLNDFESRLTELKNKVEEYGRRANE